MKLAITLAAATAAILIGTAAFAQQQPAAPAAPAAPTAPAAPAAPAPEKQPMSFFITSSSQTGDLGGLEGADAICQGLAEAAGVGTKTWHAYLSTQGDGAVNARDRIGSGPWYNFNGALIANSVADLHGDNARDRSQMNIFFALDDKGEKVNGRFDTPNLHDILTGSDSLGMALPAGEDRTCHNWTDDGPDGIAMFGHHDRVGAGNSSWNSAHTSRGGCSAEAFTTTGGAGKLYCFATN